MCKLQQTYYLGYITYWEILYNRIDLSAVKLTQRPFPLRLSECRSVDLSVLIRRKLLLIPPLVTRARIRRKLEGHLVNAVKRRAGVVAKTHITTINPLTVAFHKLQQITRAESLCILNVLNL